MEGAVEAFGNVYVGMDVGAAVRLLIVRRQNEDWHAVASRRSRRPDLSAEGRGLLCEFFVRRPLIKTTRGDGERVSAASKDVEAVGCM